MIDPEAVLRFCEQGKTNAEAAEHFGFSSDRRVREYKNRAKAKRLAGGVTPQPRDASTAPKASAVTAPAPTFRENAEDEIAGEHTMWLDPWTKELMHPPPGMKRGDWERERKGLQRRHLARLAAFEAPPDDPANASEASAPPPPPADVIAIASPPPPPAEQVAAPVPPPPPVVAPVPIIIVKRLAPDPPRRTPFRWQRYVPPPQFLVALVVTLVLIGMCSL